MERDRRSAFGAADGLTGLTVAVICSAAPPALSALTGGVAVGALLGVGGGIATGLDLAELVVIGARRRAREPRLGRAAGAGAPSRAAR